MPQHTHKIRLREPNDQGSAVPEVDAPEVLSALSRMDDTAWLRSASRRLWLRGKVPAAAALSVFADLSAQRWTVEVSGDEILVSPPDPDPRPGEETRDAKVRVRAGLEARRTEELDTPAVQAFLRGAESRRAHRGRRVSVLDLVDSGVELAERCRSAVKVPGPEGLRALKAVVSPEIELVDSSRRCTETGLLLNDVWRYFRYTWSLPARSVPGRTLAFLVRNGARPNRPVMGIGALSSPVPQLTAREDWVGWSRRQFTAQVEAAPQRWGEALGSLRATIATAFSELKVDDLVPPGDALSVEDLQRHLERQRAAADRARGERLAHSGRPRTLLTGADFALASMDPLFVRKRARLAAELLRAQAALARAEAATPPRGGKFADEEIDRAVGIALRELRKIGLASRVLDLNVCGAVAPYGALLAGKLVALAAASRELADAYSARYSKAPGLIASQLAGRPVFRLADFVAATTTSLYGVGSSQYNRLRVGVRVGDDTRELRWEEVGRTEGISSLYLSKQTIELLALVSPRRTSDDQEYDDVNYQFGEGTGARMRRARRGLAALFTPVSALLVHHSYRRMYALEVCPGARRSLLMNEPSAGLRPTFEAICEAWAQRWLRPRMERQETLESVRAEGPHTVAQRLAAPSGDQLLLFQPGATAPDLAQSPGSANEE